MHSECPDVRDVVLSPTWFKFVSESHMKRIKEIYSYSINIIKHLEKTAPFGLGMNIKLLHHLDVSLTPNGIIIFSCKHSNCF